MLTRIIIATLVIFISSQNLLFAASGYWNYHLYRNSSAYKASQGYDKRPIIHAEEKSWLNEEYPADDSSKDYEESDDYSPQQDANEYNNYGR